MNPTAIVTSPVKNPTGLRVRRQISVIENGAQVWRDADADGTLNAEIQAGEAAVVEFANTHQRWVLELTEDPPIGAMHVKPKPGYLKRILGQLAR